MRCIFQLITLLCLCAPVTAAAPDDEMVLIKGASFRPLYGSPDAKQISVKDFYLDKHLVTHQEFIDFVKSEPSWSRSKVKRLFAEKAYLQDWNEDLSVPPERLTTPVNHVSWYAARAFCKHHGKRLPLLDEWELAAMADSKSPDARTDEAFTQSLLRSYETPGTYLKEVSRSVPNYWGVHDLHGLVWEWTEDFNSVIISGESRDQSNQGLFCAAGAVTGTDLMNYAAFMRYAFRASVKAHYAIRNLGFRCAKDASG